MARSSENDFPPLTVAEFSSLPEILRSGGESAVAAAVSGGPDSMALCWLLSVWAKKNKGPQIHAITVDHGLRGESAAEARLIGKRVTGWPQVHHQILTLSGLKGKRRVMERAREGRYELMAEYCRHHGVARLFTAHHLDDQAETFLFRLAKGSGPDGLAGIRSAYGYDENLTVVRPLLGIPKARLVATCKLNKIPFVKDPTNDSPAFARNRLRQAGKALEQEGLSAKRLGITAMRMRRACDALDDYADKVFRQAIRLDTMNKTAFDFATLADAPAEIRLRVLLRVMRGDDGYGPRLERMESILAALFEDENFKKATLGGFIIALERKKGLITLQKEQN
jgi:tRNA(Ile)-lysidine synthase